LGFKNSQGLNDTRLWELFLKHSDDVEEGTNNEVSKDSGSVRRKKIQQQQKKEKEIQQANQHLQEHLPKEALLEDTDQDGKMNDFVYDDGIIKDKFSQLKKSLEWEDLNINDNFGIHPEAMNGEVYNMCHFWSNFEIARLDFFRSKEYNDYFESLDQSGGFWNERWGDAPVHSLAAGLFLEPEQIHYFRDIGYRHTTIQHCPANAPHRQRPHIPYIRDTTDKKQIEEDNYWANSDPEVPNGVGCRCRCDTDVVEVEGKDGSCLVNWVELIGGWV
jgi:mannosyltransferase